MKTIVEVLILIIGGVIYGFAKYYFDNDWNAVWLSGLYLLIAKFLLIRIMK